MKCTRRVSGFILLSVLLMSCGTDHQMKVLKLAHALDRTHPVHLAMEDMAERLEEISGGRLSMEIYPSGQLGSERELLELLQIGALDLTKVSASPLESFVPQMKIFSIPYVFRDEDHLWQVLQGPIGKRLLQSGDEYFLRGLAYYDAGSRSFYTTSQPIQRPSDLDGLKIRVQKSITSVQMIQTLGGAATPISWGELYTALQQGVVDGAENNPPSFFLSRHYEVCKYYTLDEHTSVPDVLLVSTHTWDRLSPQERDWLQTAADSSVITERDLWARATREALQAVQAAGVTIIHPDKSRFREAVQEMHASYAGTDVFGLIQNIALIGAGKEVAN